jgi:hypothetical protein
MSTSFVLTFAAGGMAVALCTQVAAHPSLPRPTADEIGRHLKGRTCTTNAGAKFAFGQDGSYAYDGLWRHAGSYSIGNGAVTVLLESGLERSFAVARKGNVYYLEDTAISCR